MKDPLEKTVVLSIACIVAIVFITIITALAVRHPYVSQDTNSGKAYGSLTANENREDSCKDTDGNNYQSYGVVSGFKDERSYRYKDVCINGDIVKEYFCEGTIPEHEYANCQALYGQTCNNGKCG